MAVQAGAHIINISLGQYSHAGDAHQLLAKVVSDCAARGVLVVAAAGNEGCDCLSIPAALPSVLAVGAMNNQGLPLEFSNWGKNYQTQGILAPGKNILGASPGGGIAISSGTSYATSIVSGVAALLASLQIKHGQRLNLHAIREAILRSALSCEAQPVPDCRRLLACRLNIEGAMSLLVRGVNTVSNVNETLEPRKPTIDANDNPTTANAWSLAPSVQSNTLAGNELSFADGTPNYSASNPLNQSMNLPGSSTACSCGNGGPMQLVFALGKLGYDFGTEVRCDSIRQHMEEKEREKKQKKLEEEQKKLGLSISQDTPQHEREPDSDIVSNPHDPVQLLDYLGTENSWDAAAIIWTLNLDATPIYAIKACGAYAAEVYLKLREFLRDQINNTVERVSIPGYIAGSTRLMNGQTVPIIQPDLRGMYTFN